MKKVDCFIVGFPKCGTTSLSTLLSNHKDVVFSKKKEPQYFSSDIFEFGQFSGKIQEYHDMFFKNADVDKLWVEGSTHYSISYVAAAKIKKYNKNAKIIFVIREPLSMLESWHNQMLVSGHEKNINFNDAWSESLKLEYADNETSLINYPEIIRFYKHIYRYINLFGQDNVLIVSFKSMVKSQNYTLNKIFESLSIDKIEGIQLPFENLRKEWRFAWLINFYRYYISMKNMLFPNFELGLKDKLNSILFKKPENYQTIKLSDQTKEDILRIANSEYDLVFKEFDVL